MKSSFTVGETVEQIRVSLRDYIEATYHISNPVLVSQRRRLLDDIAVIHQRPYIESTPKYQTSRAFKELGLDSAVYEALQIVTSPYEGKPPIVHDPPYEHQAQAVTETLLNGKSLFVMTGTGSGKTECFLLPILGSLAMEAYYKPLKFKKQRAVRAILLYPMNALVNDQLGRLRLLLGDSRLTEKFVRWSGRPATFARYTSRTLYPGVRDAKKDQTKLKPIKDYYVHYLSVARDPTSAKQKAALELIAELKSRGKWPSKPDLLKWYGADGTKWMNADGTFQRCVTLPDDSELLTRHEALNNAPDVLVTNYSMLEYMLMRPIERPIFEQTRAWLHDNPDNKLVLVVDEAHLYRGAAGTEVALLLRRLRMRLKIPPEQMQVICTSASFQDPNAAEFGAQLVGKNIHDFVTVRGKLALHDGSATASQKDAELLAQINANDFYEAKSEQAQLEIVRQFLSYRGIVDTKDLWFSLYQALVGFPPMKLLVNLTMQEARPLDDLAATLFPAIDESLAARALTSLLALGSTARATANGSGLLPCRIHCFYRGLPGLWACIDPNCPSLSVSERGGPTGKLYAQPMVTCDCGARVFELFTCRNCGTAYARAYTENLNDPDYLWAEPGDEFRTRSEYVQELAALDILLEEPSSYDVQDVEAAELDLVTGRLNPSHPGSRMRHVFIHKNREDKPANELSNESPGQFNPCPACHEQAGYGRTSVQDHQTKGDQPFLALISKQIQVQPPNTKPPTNFAPLRGRKVMLFSDSRQMAARLAPSLQSYSTLDALRPLIVTGFAKLQQYESTTPFLSLSLDDMYFAVILAAVEFDIRLRPELRDGENLDLYNVLEKALKGDTLKGRDQFLQMFFSYRTSKPPESLLLAMVRCITDKHYGLESLALASVKESRMIASKISSLPAISGIAETELQKRGLTRAWISSWARLGFWLNAMPMSWWLDKVVLNGQSQKFSSHSGRFASMKRLFPDKNGQKIFEHDWIPKLLEYFCEKTSDNAFRLRGGNVFLDIGGQWACCPTCKTAQRPLEGTDICIYCGAGQTRVINPEEDKVFDARKGYYRRSTIDALRSPPTPPLALIAAEHTAQLNAAQADKVYSMAEEHELLFQDIDLGSIDDNHRPAIDVLSCTTTMEVGIDIGSLSGVALRNMPPTRANYQQRSGRAGRRGNAVATVISFGSADSHDEHYFSNPDQMIRGKVDDPTLALDNFEIAKRHVTAYLLERYHQDRVPKDITKVPADLFSVLGKVSAFLDPTSRLNRIDLSAWLTEHRSKLQRELEEWLPNELDPSDRHHLLSEFDSLMLQAIDSAIHDLPSGTKDKDAGLSDELSPLELQSEEGEEQATVDAAKKNLLDRLLYKGVLPRYAFPTDVVTFHVFDREKSTKYRHEFLFAPSQGLSTALSQYAPGKEVWVGGKLWTSGALYSPMKEERDNAWTEKRLYYECNVCHYARTVTTDKGHLGDLLDCPACGQSKTFGKARYWIRPPGFAHPIFKEPGTSPDDLVPFSYATRARLTADTPAETSAWLVLNTSIKTHYERQHLLVTNTGPKQDGYTYCLKCGLVEPTCAPKSLVKIDHKKPYPDDEPNCSGGLSTSGMMLGTDFISDVLLISMRVEKPFTLLPGLLATDVALRTLSEALTNAACEILGLEQGELQAEYRPALTPQGRTGGEAEIYIYDTLPGGAGFAKKVGDKGLSVFEKALEILEHCPGDCDSSCYRCLRSYKNKFQHQLLDRYVGASLLRFLLTQIHAPLDSKRMEQSTNILYEDLRRQSEGRFVFDRNQFLQIPGFGDVSAPISATRNDGAKFVVCLSGSLTPDNPSSQILRDLKEFSNTPIIVSDELVVRRNLPTASSEVMRKIQ